MKWLKRDSLDTVEKCCLRNLGIHSTDEINDWFRKSYSDGYRIKGLNLACQFLSGFKEKPIWVCGDYDVDGVMATSIMVLALHAIGCKNVHYKIPKRHSQGYGLKVQIVKEIVDKSMTPGCIITVDNGISAFEAVDYAKSAGWTVIVTDHHLPQTKNGIAILPHADIVINPSAIPDSADFSGYCGAGVAYKLACALLGRKRAKYLQPLAAIATIADVMELHEENYVIVRDGLKYLGRDFAPPGLVSLKKWNEFTTVNSDEVAFKLAPEINAPGRLLDDGAASAVKLMLSDAQTADELSPKLLEINEERKENVKDAITAILLSGHDFEADPIIVEYVPGVNQGIIGIVAGKLCEKFSCPAIVFTESYTDPKQLIGSARSVDGINMKALLDATADKLVTYGGHAGASGLSVQLSGLEAFKIAVTEEINKTGFSVGVIDTMSYDLEINARDVPRVLHEMSRFEPFGCGNESLIFKIDDFTLQYRYGDPVKDIGDNGISLKGTVCNAVSFDLRDAMRELPCLDHLTLYGKLSYNQYKEKLYPRIEIIDFQSN